MQNKVQKIVLQQQMILEKEIVLAGVSGGADSVCLLLLLATLRKEMDFCLEAVHIEHGIRGEESVSDANFVKELCKQIDVPCHMISVDVLTYSKEQGIGIEEAARILRYEAFVRLARAKQAKIALAHHMEDNAETILFQMLRGSSLAGLCGMQAIRIDEHGVTYIRPLLTVHRKEIEDFLQAREQSYCIDSTNVDLDYSRNFIRNVILPKMQEINTQAVAHINHTASELTDIHDFLEEESEKAWKTVVEFTEYRGKQGKILTIHTETLKNFHIAIQKEVVYKAISYMLGAKKDISTVHVQEVLKLCQKQSGKELHLPNDLTVKKEYQYVKFFFKTYIKNHQIEISSILLEEWKNTKQTIEIPLEKQEDVLQIRVFSREEFFQEIKNWKEDTRCSEGIEENSHDSEEKNKQEDILDFGKFGKIPQKRYTKWLDYDKIKDGFCIRTRQSGDAFITDSLGHHKKLKQYLIDEKIPVTERDRLWLLAQEHTVLWLIGGRISAHMKVTEDTKMIIEFVYKGGK